MIKIYFQYMGRFLMIMYHGLSSNRMNKVKEEHIKLLERILENDKAGAIEALESHLKNAQIRLSVKDRRA